MSAEVACRLLEWDSAFFGLRIGRVTGDRLTQALADQIEKWCRDERIDCAYFLADPSDARTVRIAEARRFALTDVRITFDCRPGPAVTGGGTAGAGIRRATPEDSSALVAIARTSHADTRFFFDTRFPRERCTALYETWIEKSLHGYADAVFTADRGGRPAGYVTCHLDGPAGGRIGLVGVAEEARGVGLASGLIRASLDWFSATGVSRVTVATQGRNVSAQRLYQRCGFTTAEVRLWYHFWPKPERRENAGPVTGRSR